MKIRAKVWAGVLETACVDLGGKWLVLDGKERGESAWVLATICSAFNAESAVVKELLDAGSCTSGLEGSLGVSSRRTSSRAWQR